MLTGIAFTQLPMWVLHHQGLSFAAKCVYASLQARVNREQPELGAWPSVRTLASDLGSSPATITRAIQELVDTGVVRCESRGRAQGHLASHRYHVLVTPPDEPAETPPGRDDVPCGGHALVAPVEQDLVSPVEHLVSPVKQASCTGETYPDQYNQIKGSRRSTPPTRAREATGTARMPLVGPGESLRYDQQQRKIHAGHHPEVCRWRDPTVRVCMPSGMPEQLAERLAGVPLERALEDVIAWARADVPPAGHVGSSDAWVYWRDRWDQTRATASAKPRRGQRPVTSSSAAIPDAAATDALLEELGWRP